MKPDRLHHPDLEQRPAKPSDVTEIIRYLLNTALQTESSLVSIGVVGPAISFSDDGAGWSKKDLKMNYPLYKLRHAPSHKAGMHEAPGRLQPQGRRLDDRPDEHC